ncbi:MAG TPA: radical SAM protein [Candidatus Rubrimentiphilum sp.]|nr:radical SAM protein [Candidatus Rubrimentiphilum sp.]
MLNVTKLLCGIDQPMDALRYGHGSGAPSSARQRKPVVVWNVSRTCNLRCLHCYSDSAAREYPGELSHAQGIDLLKDLAAFGVPAVLLSGGEPLARRDTLALAEFGRMLGLKFTLSTNGTLIDERTAARIRDIGFSYVGISIDGIGPTNDAFRGAAGAYDRAVRGIRNCKAAGQKVGLRLTLTPQTAQDLDEIFDFIEAEGIDRACFYHLVPTGRGRGDMMLDPAQTRTALDTIFKRTREFAANGSPREILTVDNHADAAYLYLTLLEDDPIQAARAYDALAWNGGGANSSGVGIADIDTQGNVHPDQFFQSVTLGNVKTRRFSEIWTDQSNELLQALRASKRRIHGRCADCRFMPICGGNFRARAFNLTGDLWASDPGCYLDDATIGATA